MPTLGETIRVLAEERVLGESAAALLFRYGGNDPELLAEAERTYTVAQAAFNGLIAELQMELAESRKPNESESFDRALLVAVEKRKAWLALVTQRTPHQEGTRSGVYGLIVDALAGTAADVIGAVTEAAIGLWREFRKARQERREEIRARLDAERWRPFAEVARSGGIAV
jgi:hypothetical protein